MQADGTPKTWTDERIETLKALWAEGLSARMIAERLDGVTRNTVIGKLDRLGLLGGQRPVPAVARTPVETPPVERAPRRSPELEPPEPVIDELALDAEALEIQALEVARTVPAVPSQATISQATNADAPLVGVQGLKPLSCRWPVGDPQDAAFGFCGAKALGGKPYCAHHAAMAYEPPRERRRA